MLLCELSRGDENVLFCGFQSQFLFKYNLKTITINIGDGH
jgi:hypothetical protein